MTDYIAVKKKTRIPVHYKQKSGSFIFLVSTEQLHLPLIHSQ